jgi:sensor histidine kinase YesM
VRIAAEIRGKRLVFRCDNSQPANAVIHHGGVGLENLRRRLRLYYGNHFVLQSRAVGNDWQAELQLELT